VNGISAVGDEARLETPVFPASIGRCYLRFWYFMNDGAVQQIGATESMGTLKVCGKNI
jgi:hypothetical protein